VLRRAVLQLARQHSFACALIDTGRLCTPHHYGGLATFDSGPDDGKSIRNVALSRAGRPCGLIDVLRESGAAPTAFAFGASGAEAKALSAAAVVAKLPLRVCRVGTDIVDAHGLLAAETGARAGSIALLRPDGHLAALLANADPKAVVVALRRTLGRVAAPDPASRAQAEEVSA